MIRSPASRSASSAAAVAVVSSGYPIAISVDIYEVPSLGRSAQSGSASPPDRRTAPTHTRTSADASSREDDRRSTRWIDRAAANGPRSEPDATGPRPVRSALSGHDQSPKVGDAW